MSASLASAAFSPRSPADALSHGIAMVHQHFSLVPDMAVLDNLLLGQARGVLDRKAGAARIAAMRERYGLALDPLARVQELSVGERQRVEIVKCLMREPRLLVLDEPTAVLLPEEIEALLTVCTRVAQQGCGVVLVTHKLAEIQRVARRATVLRGGRVVARSDAPAQDIEALVREVDVVSPMLYPSGFTYGIPGVRDPVAAPREIVERSLRRAVERTGVPAVRFRPWLQAFRDYAFDHREFGGAQVRAQVDAAEAVGTQGWMLWNARNRYDDDGLKADGPR